MRLVSTATSTMTASRTIQKIRHSVAFSIPAGAVIPPTTTTTHTATNSPGVGNHRGGSAARQRSA
jgi:hypothetical protein